MSTGTYTYTKVDIRRVAECFAADLAMLVSRTDTMDYKWAEETAYDITLMAQHECLDSVHVQLTSSTGVLLSAHKYKVEGLRENWGSNRPGENNWPRAPGGELRVIVAYSDNQKANDLKNSGKLLRNWSPTSQSIDYSEMRETAERTYSSNGYGWRRQSYKA